MGHPGLLYSGGERGSQCLDLLCLSRLPHRADWGEAGLRREEPSCIRAEVGRVWKHSAYPQHDSAPPWAGSPSVSCERPVAQVGAEEASGTCGRDFGHLYQSGLHTPSSLTAFNPTLPQQPVATHFPLPLKGTQVGQLLYPPGRSPQLVSPSYT